MKKVIDRGKRSKTLSEVKPVGNINNYLQSFLEISPMQKEVFPSHKLQDHAYEQEYQEGLIQGKIHNQQNSDKGLQYL